MSCLPLSMLVICIFSLFSLISLARVLPIFQIFSKNQLLVSLIFLSFPVPVSVVSAVINLFCVLWL